MQLSPGFMKTKSPCGQNCLRDVVNP
ncbi:hypothetical protein Nmel_011054 [Mimus melanotis]